MGELGRLRWQCRRGMLELDHLLLSFVDNEYPSLSAEQQQAFQRLLDAIDPELMAWIMGDAKPSDDGVAEMVERLRNHQIND